MRKGFTLIEVLVVAVIVAILAAVAIPAYTNYTERAALRVCQNVASTIATTYSAEVQEGTSITAQAAATGTLALGANSVTIPEGVTAAWTANAAEATVTVTHIAQNQSAVQTFALSN